MTPEESQGILFAGTGLFDNILSLIFLIHILLRKKSNGRTQKALIAFLLVGFGMATLYGCQNIVFNLLLVKFGLVLSLPGGIIAQEMVANSKSLVTDIVELLMADMAILWRAQAIWVENRLIKWTLLIILLSDIGVNIADAIVDTKLLINSVVNTITLDWLSIVLNLMVNVVATLLIAYRAWTHHQLIHSILRSKKTQVEAILILFVESGAVFGVIQICNVIIQAMDTHAMEFSLIDRIRVVFAVFFIFSAAINPVALVILVQTSDVESQIGLVTIKSGRGQEGQSGDQQNPDPKGWRTFSINNPNREQLTWKMCLAGD
ncbi:hypothetical protein BT96DRAFT_974613 [Gymnopus androsaceus JB14]|uniref:Uncharacterized protein n=1 Tax=Gymnopus androsaceus JB14 TaxID=1447944 RepID=A0A6A4HV63_9AGAR|nr:hypothetical protein BT96DRAFT_974613 [Gymnopus androsaceus JB14]